MGTAAIIKSGVERERAAPGCPEAPSRRPRARERAREREREREIIRQRVGGGRGYFFTE